jgi:hypothetical protein
VCLTLEGEARIHPSGHRGESNPIPTAGNVDEAYGVARTTDLARPTSQLALKRPTRWSTGVALRGASLLGCRPRLEIGSEAFDQVDRARLRYRTWWAVFQELDQLPGLQWGEHPSDGMVWDQFHKVGTDGIAFHEMRCVAELNRGKEPSMSERGGLHDDDAIAQGEPPHVRQSFRAHSWLRALIKVCSDRRDVARCLSRDQREAPTGKCSTPAGFHIAEEAEKKVRGTFVEKPDAATAARYVADGCLWNSGNFMSRRRRENASV